ncbi:hypothetical protein C455_00417 [Haloferax larsenii JCM 13917]|nr:hypothetical protein [Haloferax larsenii]ELZ84122.1 hypothetical protein C455_00417 [Haloferax larsenii JCM 13917]
MTDHATVGRALRELADSDAPSRRRQHEAVVAAARDAFSTLERAADFLDEDGEERLRRAVGAAARQGDHDVAREGRALLDALDSLRSSLDSPNSVSERRPVQSGRTTVFSGGGEAADR